MSGPPSARHRDRKKKGFGIPIAAWFKGELRNELQDELGLARMKAQGLFEPSAVQRLVSEHLSGAATTESHSGHSSSFSSGIDAGSSARIPLR